MADQSYQKKISYLGFAYFTVMSVIAVLYFKERLLTVDSAYYTFKILQFENFNIEHERYGSYLTQWLPLIFIKAGASLKTVMISYSFSFILFYYLLFLFVVRVLRSPNAGIALMLTTCLAIRDSFFSPVSEFPQGMALAVVLYALCETELKNSGGGKKVLYALYALIVIIIVSYFHLLLGLALCFIPAYFIISQKRFGDLFLWGMIGVTILVFATKILMVPAGSYQGAKMPGIAEFKTYLPKLRELPSTKFFIDFSRHYYQTTILIIVLSNLYLLLRKRDILTVLYNFLVIMGFLILVFVTYYQGETIIMYENYFMLLGLFAAIPLCASILPLMSNRICISLISILLIINTYQLWSRHHQYSVRVTYIDKITEYGRSELKSHKILADLDNVPGYFVAVRWAFAFETILYSALEGPENSTTVFPASNVDEVAACLNTDTCFLGADFARYQFSPKTLNKKYFILKDEPYVLLNHSQCETGFAEKDFTKDNIRISTAASVITLERDYPITLPVTITNLSGKRLNSATCDTNQILIAYHLYDEHDNMISHDGVRSPLEVDINKSYTQNILLELPWDKKIVKVKLDLVSENKRWMGIEEEVTVKLR